MNLVSQRHWAWTVECFKHFCFELKPARTDNQ